eukprot:CAMPEP_0176312792 /NCGR_PEP_ID=MMETSP0121_2-20121125/66845_1 /TAXON_ID=160619 /ORGANISM="Kryptoperidinium foliaceum, Strain CCMP 1326" /LENGTH=258 /DNA_ID=CAMNT_0017654873 /DNA_START=77 /DNA_END=849 /DNA_ORIENTATION=+
MSGSGASATGPAWVSAPRCSPWTRHRPPRWHRPGHCGGMDPGNIGIVPIGAPKSMGGMPPGCDIPGMLMPMGWKPMPGSGIDIPMGGGGMPRLQGIPGGGMPAFMPPSWPSGGIPQPPSGMPSKPPDGPGGGKAPGGGKPPVDDVEGIVCGGPPNAAPVSCGGGGWRPKAAPVTASCGGNGWRPRAAPVTESCGGSGALPPPELPGGPLVFSAKTSPKGRRAALLDALQVVPREAGLEHVPLGLPEHLRPDAHALRHP